MAKKDVARVKMKANKFRINPEEITWACPDPTWEYAEIWHQLQQAKADIEQVLVNMSELETINIVTDTDLRQQIKTVRDRLEFAEDILAP